MDTDNRWQFPYKFCLIALQHVWRHMFQAKQTSIGVATRLSMSIVVTGLAYLFWTFLKYVSKWLLREHFKHSQINVPQSTKRFIILFKLKTHFISKQPSFVLIK